VLAADSVAGPATGDTAPTGDAPGGATDRPCDWTSQFDAAESRLTRHLSRDDAWARCNADGEPDPLSGYWADATALAALAWCALHDRGYPDALDHARHLLRHVADRHQFPGVPGIRDRADADSQVRVDREDHAVAYLAACRAPSGGYAETPGGRPDTFATFRAVDSLIALGLQPPELDRTVDWLRLLQGDDGGFRYREGGPESFVGTYHAVAALYVVGEQPPAPASCIRWIAERQTPDGGFSRTRGGHSETTDEGFIAIQALHMLEGKLNPYWAVIMT
jgi:hypothetical protein